MFYVDQLVHILQIHFITCSTTMPRCILDSIKSRLIYNLESGPVSREVSLILFKDNLLLTKYSFDKKKDHSRCKPLNSQSTRQAKAWHPIDAMMFSKSVLIAVSPSPGLQFIQIIPIHKNVVFLYKQTGREASTLSTFNCFRIMRLTFRISVLT